MHCRGGLGGNGGPGCYRRHCRYLASWFRRMCRTKPWLISSRPPGRQRRPELVSIRRDGPEAATDPRRYRDAAPLKVPPEIGTPLCAGAEPAASSAQAQSRHGALRRRRTRRPPDPAESSAQAQSERWALRMRGGAAALCARAVRSDACALPYRRVRSAQRCRAAGRGSGTGSGSGRRREAPGRHRREDPPGAAGTATRTGPAAGGKRSAAGKSGRRRRRRNPGRAWGWG